MNLDNAIRHLLDKEAILHNHIQSNPQYATTPEGYSDMEEWINDVDIFNQKYLKTHPLHQRIKTIIFHRKSTAITDLVACLRSILNENTLLKKDESMNDYEECLRIIVDNYDVNKPFNTYKIEHKYVVIIEKLRELKLIKNVNYMSDGTIMLSLTYDGLHYFNEKQIQKGEADFEHRQIKYLQYDVFISHASKDKLDYVEQLKCALDRLNIKIFYDKDSIKWGDKWKQRILEGVSSSEFAIIVISENFFGREWTEKELNELLNRQNDSGQKIILPLLHNITVEQLEEKYPEVADIQAINTSDFNDDEITYLFAEQLIKRLKEQRA